MLKTRENYLYRFYLRSLHRLLLSVVAFSFFRTMFLPPLFLSISLCPPLFHSFNPSAKFFSPFPGDFRKISFLFHFDLLPKRVHVFSSPREAVCRRLAFGSSSICGVSGFSPSQRERRTYVYTLLFPLSSGERITTHGILFDLQEWGVSAAT